MVGQTWAEYVPKIPGLKTGAGFRHQNFFFLPDKVQPLEPFATEGCSGLQAPKYLTRTKWKPCFPGYQFRPKVMTRPNLTLELGVHHVFETLPGFSGNVKVPTDVAIMGHYRIMPPDNCMQQKKIPVVKNWASKYSKQLHQYICDIS